MRGTVNPIGIVADIGKLAKKDTSLEKLLNRVIPFTTNPTWKKWNDLFRENNKFLARKYKNDVDGLERALIGQILYQLQGLTAGKLSNEEFPIVFQDIARYKLLLLEAIKTIPDLTKREKILGELKVLSEKYPYVRQFLDYNSKVFKGCIGLSGLGKYYADLMKILDSLYDSFKLIYTTLLNNKSKVYTDSELKALKELPELLNFYIKCINIRLGLMLEKLRSLEGIKGKAGICQLSNVKYTNTELSEIKSVCTETGYISTDITDILTELSGIPLPPRPSME